MTKEEANKLKEDINNIRDNPLFNMVSKDTIIEIVLEKIDMLAESEKSMLYGLPSEDCVARSEALDILDDFEEDVENGKFKTAYAKARERMCELPPVTPSYNSIKPELKPSEDCISRQYLIERATSWDKHFADSERCVSLTEIQNAPSVTPKASEQQPSREWKEIYAESEGSNSWIEFKCPHCGYSFGMESGEYDWHYGDEIPWKYCPICGGSAQHKPYKTESEDKNDT